MLLRKGEKLLTPPTKKDLRIQAPNCAEFEEKSNVENKVSLAAFPAMELTEGEYTFEDSDSVLELDWQKPRRAKQRSAPSASLLQWTDSESDGGDFKYHHRSLSASNATVANSKTSSERLSLRKMRTLKTFLEDDAEGEVGDFRSKMFTLRGQLLNSWIPDDEVKIFTPLMLAVIANDAIEVDRLIQVERRNFWPSITLQS